MAQELSLKQVQQTLFSASAVRSSEKLPLKIALDAVSDNSLAYNDLAELRDKGLIAWDLAMKANSCMTPVSNADHILQCVAYYGNAENGRSCIGFGLGCINNDGTAIELNLIEKRRDSGVDLKSKLLPIIVDAFSLYGLYLNNNGLANISKFVIVGPIESVVPYYRESGFQYVENYLGSGVDAMYMNLEDGKV
ncbi:hypothetical protein SBW85_19795 [Vibrio plantisponsor]|uniref:N-acetyltransferase n=1 Tax=Vibrio plantisponsor TaxID=664643 RepID=A0ABU4IQ10_9VIBR|nr:hypothetical protein [Vibrio plantisponsor]MDW6019952.1 hypothetical protein [Vibrio plantisponsor]NNM42649.1 hypothetical protein [Vibrio plantisponsor]